MNHNKILLLKASNKKFIAFTLVELLVSIAIILVLASLLITAMKRVRDLSRGIQCMNNMRQVGLSLTNYANDHEGLLPYYYSTITTKTWKQLLNTDGYLPFSAVYVCPSGLPQFSINNVSYGYSLGINANLCITSLGCDLSSIVNPATAILMADTRRNSTDGSQWYYFKLYAYGESTVYTRHSGGANILFVDGHVTYWGSGCTNLNPYIQ